MIEDWGLVIVLGFIDKNHEVEIAKDQYQKLINAYWTLRCFSIRIFKVSLALSASSFESISF